MTERPNETLTLSPEYSGLVERLTRPIVGIANRTPEEAFDIMAARIRNNAAIRDLVADNARLREALEPFACLSECLDDFYGDSQSPSFAPFNNAGQIRKARAALSGRMKG